MTETSLTADGAAPPDSTTNTATDSTTNTATDSTVSSVPVKPTRPIRVVLIGPPGSGKGSQSRKLLSWYKPVCPTMSHISTGHLLREIKNKDHGEIGEYVRRNWHVSKLSDVVVEIVERAVLGKDPLNFGDLVYPRNPNESQSLPQDPNPENVEFILDGSSRTLHETIKIERLLERRGISIDCVIRFVIGEDELRKRTTGGRLVHPPSGRTYHKVYDPPKVPGKDDVTGEDLICKDDLTEESIVLRYKSFKQNSTAVIKFYQDRGILFNIDASLDKESVFAQIRKVIECDRFTRIKRHISLEPDPIELIADYIPKHSSLSHTILQKMQRLSNSKFESKFPGSHPVSLVQDVLQGTIALHRQQYVYSIKADGLRQFLMIHERNGYFINRRLEVYRLRQEFFRPNSSSEETGGADTNRYQYEQLEDSLFDGELVLEFHPVEQVDIKTEFPPRTIVLTRRLLFIIFDALALNGQSLRQQELFQRLSVANSYFITPFNAAKYPTLFANRLMNMPLTTHYLHQINSQVTASGRLPFVDLNITAQHFFNNSEITDVMELYMKNRPYAVDGLMLINSTRWYKLGLDDHAQKWKPLHKNTVDFHLHIIEDVSPQRILSTDPLEPDSHSDARFELHVLNDYGELTFYEQFVFHPDDESKWRDRIYDGCIIECWLDIHNKGSDDAAEQSAEHPFSRWRVCRIRTDKSTPNTLWVTMKIRHSIEEDISEQQLIDILERMPILETTAPSPPTSGSSSPVFGDTVQWNPQEYPSNINNGNGYKADEMLPYSSSSSMPLTMPPMFNNNLRGGMISMPVMMNTAYSLPFPQQPYFGEPLMAGNMGALLPPQPPFFFMPAPLFMPDNLNRPASPYTGAAIYKGSGLRSSPTSSFSRPGVIVPSQMHRGGRSNRNGYGSRRDKQFYSPSSGSPVESPVGSGAASPVLSSSPGTTPLPQTQDVLSLANGLNI